MNQEVEENPRETVERLNQNEGVLDLVA